VSIILSAVSLLAITLMGLELSVDAGLWVGISLCAASIFGRHGSGSPFLTSLAFGAAMLLTSLALVAA
jgi:hypothetical protein